MPAMFNMFNTVLNIKVCKKEISRVLKKFISYQERSHVQNLAVKGGILGVICEKGEEGFPSNWSNQEGFGGTGD